MKVQKETQGNKFIKSITIAALFLLTSICCKAQEQLIFPFQGGVTIMNRFFKDSLTVSPEIVQKKATGTVVLKFTADPNGNVKKIIIYYADDYLLTTPVIEALKRSNHKWIIPDHQKLHDFIISFSINFNTPAVETPALAKEVYRYYKHRHPIVSVNQVPIDDVTLLPTVSVDYDLPK
ncbi:MAG: hypothetical protein ACHQF4_00520 [Sphingobacteriales bacterium]